MVSSLILKERIEDLEAQKLLDILESGKLYDLNYSIGLMREIADNLEEYQKTYIKVITANSTQKLLECNVIESKEHYFEFLYYGDAYEIPNSEVALKMENIRRINGDKGVCEYFKEEIDDTLDVDFDEDFDEDDMCNDVCYIQETYVFVFIDGSSLSISGEYYGDCEYMIDDIDADTRSIAHLIKRQMDFKEFIWDLDVDEFFNKVTPLSK
jgi:hypothetical protein